MAALGAWSGTNPANAVIRALCETAKDKVEAYTGGNYALFDAVSYREQVVAGTNYIIKIHVGDGKNGYIHAWLFKSLQNEIEVKEVEEDKTKDDPINV